jgi:thiol-disulfide isomerase/thioredoxin
MSGRRGVALLFGLGLGLLGTALAAADAPRTFGTGSYRSILAAEPGRPLVVAFWSLDCAHCLEELPRLGAWADRHPAVRLVLVSTDAPDDARAVTTTLRNHGLARHEAWLFADEPPERLRHEVDPRWRGELPRHTLRAPDGALRTILGQFDPPELDRWLAGPPAGR